MPTEWESKCAAAGYNPCDECPKDGNTCHTCTLECHVGMAFEYRSRIASLESSLAERERECERLRGELAGSDVNVRELWARAESAESALAEREREAECELSRRAQVALSEIVGLHYIVSWPELTARVTDAIQSAESSLAERERECERLRGELAGSDVNVRELWARAESAESALAEREREAECELSRRAQVALSEIVGLHYIVSWPELTARVTDAIQSAEAALAERERECERLRGELAGSDVNVRELWARAESAESALAAAREENGRLRQAAEWWPVPIPEPPRGEEP